MLASSCIALLLRCQQKANNMETIGELIRKERHKQGVTTAALAQALGIHRPNMYRIFEARSIDTDLLMRISLFLRHNFFEDLSACYLHKVSLD